MATDVRTRVLVTGSLGQIGSELSLGLRERYGAENVVATDLRADEKGKLSSSGPFERLDVLNQGELDAVIDKYGITVVYHLAALLSKVAEDDPSQAWRINMGGLFNVLEAARLNSCSVFFPSSIGVFGPGTPQDGTPQDTVQRPRFMYGVTKVAGELLCDYYHKKFGVDARGVRYPGIISHETLPGGGTTDYAVQIFYDAIKMKQYTCFLKPDTSLDMMYMPDAIKAAVSLMEANPEKLSHRNAFNVTAMHFTPDELANEIKKHIPEFRIDYKIDRVRQEIANSWPHYMDDSVARAEWGWKPDYDIAGMTRDMIEVLSKKYRGGLI